MLYLQVIRSYLVVSDGVLAMVATIYQIRCYYPLDSRYMYPILESFQGIKFSKMAIYIVIIDKTEPRAFHVVEFRGCKQATKTTKLFYFKNLPMYGKHIVHSHKATSSLST